MHSTLTPNAHHARRGNLLVGCGVVILILVLLAGIGAFFVATNWRGWSASLATQGFDTALTKAQIDPAEHAEIMVHVEDLMARFENKEVSLEDLGRVLGELAESPVIPSAMVMAIDNLYINDSDLEDSEKTQSRIELARYTNGLFAKTIGEETLSEVLAQVSTRTPDDNDIPLNLTVGSNGQHIAALRSADEVTLEDIRTLIATAKAHADEAGITETPDQIDLSDEIAKAIGVALGEIENDSVEETAEESVEDIPTTDDGP